MKSIIIFNLFAITAINPIVYAHENHDHQIYNWSKSKKNSTKFDSTLNVEELDDKKNKANTNSKSSWIIIFKR